MVEIEVTDGSGLIEIRTDHSFSMLRSCESISVTWRGDDDGTDDRLVVLGYSEEYRQAVNERVRPVVGRGLAEEHPVGTKTEAEVAQGLRPLFQLLESGRYRLTIQAELFDGRWDLVRPYLFDEDGIFGEEASYWDGIDVHLMNTLLTTLMDQDRVDHFERCIMAGERPVAIVYTVGEYQFRKRGPLHLRETATMVGGLFILDGHHKLAAYRRLGVAPPVILIEKVLDADAPDERNHGDRAELKALLPERLQPP